MTVMTDGWVKRLADDERQRDAARAHTAEVAARKADLVRLHGRRLLDELRASVLRDIDAFREEFPGDAAREIVFEEHPADGGFVVRKPEIPAAALTVTLQLQAASVSCEYRFTAPNGLPPRSDRLDFVIASASDDTLRLTHHGTSQPFTTADALSEYLLAPVFTGRPR